VSVPTRRINCLSAKSLYVTISVKEELWTARKPFTPMVETHAGGLDESSLLSSSGRHSGA